MVNTQPSHHHHQDRLARFALIGWWVPFLLVVLSMVSGLGCGSESSTPSALPERSLIDHHAWQVVPSQGSPFRVPQTARPCPLGDRARYEDLGGEPTFAVETRDCDYATVFQPVLTRLDQGETVALRFWNFRLSSPVGTVAHVVVQIDDTIIWEADLPIPSASGLNSTTWTSPRDFQQGAPIYFHVKNHGQNEYNLVEVTAGGSP